VQVEEVLLYYCVIFKSRIQNKDLNWVRILELDKKRTNETITWADFLHRAAHFILFPRVAQNGKPDIPTRWQCDPTRSATVYPRGLRPSRLQVGPIRQELLPLSYPGLHAFNAEICGGRSFRPSESESWQQPPHGTPPSPAACHTRHLLLSTRCRRVGFAERWSPLGYSVPQTALGIDCDSIFDTALLQPYIKPVMPSSTLYRHLGWEPWRHQRGRESISVRHQERTAEREI
jgi:hypothetical protein